MKAEEGGQAPFVRSTGHRPKVGRAAGRQTGPVPLFPPGLLVVFLLQAVVFAAQPSSRETPGASDRPTIPVCIIVDDPSPFINQLGVGDKKVCAEIPTSFYLEFGRWAQQANIKGKFSVVPCSGGIKPIDGSLGEYPGHTREERLEWIEMVKTLFEPRFTITPEIITHWYPWDIEGRTLQPGPTKENVWLAAQPPDVQTRYVAEAMQMLKNAGITAGGLTMCWRYPVARDNVLGEAVLHAAEKVYGLKYVMVFNENGDQPRVIFRRDDGAMAVSLRPSVDDVFEHSYGKKTEADIQRDADGYITADGSQGKFVARIKAGKCVIFYTHAQTLYGNGTKSGLKVFQIAVDRLQQHYGDRISWMTGLEICRHFCPPDK